MSRLLTRRGLIVGGGAAAGTLLAGCARVDNTWPVPAVLDAADALTRGAQRLLLRQRPLARELSLADISAHFPLSGTSMPKADAYRRLLDEEFASWRLRVHGLVDRPLALSLAQLRSLPARSQITLHQCDEGWSAVAQWTGVPLARLLALAGAQRSARYVVFHCLDKVELDGNHYYESLDLLDAVHPQTILAYGMNGKPLPVEYGAPLRLRVEVQIGYKNAKYVDRIEVVDSLRSIGKGRGGWWEDFDHALWYAGL
jgi:DMSO/TMAO reductase YedYZ molybdopterin-dependent catalytic subunit